MRYTRSFNQPRDFYKASEHSSGPPQLIKNIASPFYVLFHWVTSRFRSLRKSGLRKAKNDNGLIIYDELSVIWYNIDYCRASSSPDHRVRSWIEFRKGVFSFNNDVMVIAH